jgi:hypothetical protein
MAKVKKVNIAVTYQLIHNYLSKSACQEHASVLYRKKNIFQHERCLLLQRTE